MGSIALQGIDSDSGHFTKLKNLSKEMEAKLFVLFLSIAAVMTASVRDSVASSSAAPPPSSSAAPGPSSSAAPEPSSSAAPGPPSSAAPGPSSSASTTADTTTTTAGATTGFISTTIIAACVLSKLFY